MTNEQWDKISSRVRAVLNYGITKTAWLQKSRMARLVASVPFLAGCEKAEETSFTNLTIYLMSLDESVRDIYFHKPDDDEDIYRRLFPISHFVGGDIRIIQCCLDLMALSMVSNYQKDVESDTALGKYNPVAEGKWNFQAISGKLVEAIKQTITPEISAIFSVDDALPGLWEN